MPVSVIFGKIMDAIKMQSGYFYYYHLIKLSLFNSKNTQARWTPRRCLIMAFLFPALVGLQTIHWICFFMDDIFFKAYKDIKIKEPLFIVGVPRSGTTLLQRILSNDTDKFTTCMLWELLFAPAIIERKFFILLGKLDAFLGKPVFRLINYLDRFAFKGLDDIHLASLTSPEEDYFLLLPVCACFLLIHIFPFDDELWHLAYFDDQMPETDKKYIMSFYTSCLKRHLYIKGADKQILSKNPSFTPMIQTLRQQFPDCKIIGCVRNPLQVVPSLVSSMMTGVHLFDNDPKDHVFRDQLIQMLIHYYKHMHRCLPELPENRHCYVTMESLKNNLQHVVENIYDRFEYKVSPQFQAFLTNETTQAKGYKSQHRYSLDQFDIPAKSLEHELADIFQKYGFLKS